MNTINAKHVSLSATWASTAYGNAYFEVERSRLVDGMKQSIGPSTLQIGSMLDESVVVDLDLPYRVKAQLGSQPSAHSTLPADISADPGFLPFAKNTFSTVLLPHVLESHSLPHQVLREAHRVLQAEGYVLITGFNPSSLVGLQRWLRPKSALAGKYYTAGRVKDWLSVLGFEVIESSMFQYGPIISKPRLRSWLHFLESVGERCLPMFGGGYMIVAKKKVMTGTPVGKVRFGQAKQKILGVSAYNGIEKTQSRNDTKSK